MRRRMMKSKIHRATVTDADLHYVVSITVDRDLMDAADLSFPVEVVGCPIVREPDGLAMSSRNAYLTPEERDAAPVLQQALKSGVAAVLAGERDPAAVTDLVGRIIAAEPLAELDYVALVDPATLEPPTGQLRPGTYRLLIAARIGIPRLLDNIALTVPP